MKRKLASLIPVLLLTVWICTGCWDRREIVDVAIVMITGVDEGQKPGIYRVDAHIAEPIRIGGPGQSGSGQKQKEPVTHVVTEARNIDEARSKMERMLSRDIVTSHRRVYLIGEALARRGIKDLLDQISRSPMNRISTLLVVTEKAKAEKLIAQQVPLENFGVEHFRELSFRKTRIPTSLKDYFIASTTPGQQPITASFAKTKENKIILSGIAIFRDNKLEGFVKGKEAIALTGMLGGKTGGSITIRISQVKGDLSIRLDRLKVQRKVAISKGEPKFTFQVKAYGRILDNRTNLDLSNPEIIQKLNKAFAEEMEETFQSLFRRLQREFRTDSSGMGAMIYRKYPGYWKRIEKDWPEMYPDQTIKWQVSAKITGVGSIGAPLFIPENEVKK
ncbi:MAG: Ger(x)C family spore germination protein [Bacillota bacterium]